MTFLFGFLAGVAAYWLFWRFCTFAARRWFSDGVHAKARQQFFARMTYTQLRGFRAAVDDELARRQAPLGPL